MPNQIKKYKETIQKEEEQKESLDKEIQKNENLLSELKDFISKLTISIKSKQLSLINLKDQEREREAS